jgi:hypothetical protein
MKDNATIFFTQLLILECDEDHRFGTDEPKRQLTRAP